MTDLLNNLWEMTRTLGQDHLQYVIIGEGNTSCRIDNETFYVKASGQQMATITPEGFVAVRFDGILDLLDNLPSTRAEQKARMIAAKVEPDVDAVPSIETGFHALLLHDCDAKFIGHTHPVAVNQLLCSNRAEAFAKNRTAPDEVVLCGPESVLVPYADPGFPLALLIRERVKAYMDKYDEAPKVILLENHGVIVLGSTPQEVVNITAMCVKAAHILRGAYTVGEPVFMSEEDIMHIYKRPDEIYRRKLFVNEGK